MLAYKEHYSKESVGYSMVYALWYFGTLDIIW